MPSTPRPGRANTFRDAQNSASRPTPIANLPTDLKTSLKTPFKPPLRFFTCSEEQEVWHGRDS
nr:MAG TPA: hypothetical protein [Caudoviricetes sp.]